MNARRPQHHPPQSVLLRRSLTRARDLDGLYERLVLVEHAALLGRLDAVEHVELLELHRRRWRELSAGGAA